MKNNWAVVGLAVVFSVNVSAQQRQQPLAPAKPPELKTLVVETVEPYRVQEYTPPLVLAADVGMPQVQFDHPERTMVAYFSAMARGSYADFLNCWTADSVALLEGVNKKLKRSPENWERLWRETVAGKKMVVTHWLNYGRYVLLNYRIDPVGSGGSGQEATAVFVEEVSGRWKLTQALRADALPQHWRVPEGRVRLPADALFER